MAEPALISIPANALPNIWAKVQPFLDLCADGSSGKFKTRDIVRGIACGEFQLWGEATAEEEIIAIVVTRLVVYPQLKACELVGCTGRGREDWTDHLAYIEEWARRNGCHIMQPVARRGWERVLKSHGYHPTHVILEKKL